MGSCTGYTGDDLPRASGPPGFCQGAIAEDVTTLGSTGDCSISTDIFQWGYTGDIPLLFTQTQSLSLRRRRTSQCVWSSWLLLEMLLEKTSLHWGVQGTAVSQWTVLNGVIQVKTSIVYQTQSQAFGGGGGVPSVSGPPDFCWRRRRYAGEYKELQYLSGQFSMGLYK